MKTNIETIDGITVIEIEGRLDTLSSAEFGKQIEPLLTKKNLNIIINCTDLEYICSSGLREFLRLQQSAISNESTMTIEGLNQNIREVLKMTGFSSILSIK